MYYSEKVLFTITEKFSISPFTSLYEIFMGTKSSAVGFAVKICEITAVSKKYKSIIKKQTK